MRGRTLFNKSGLMTQAGKSKQEPFIGWIGLKNSNAQETDDSKFQSTAKASLLLNMEVALQFKICWNKNKNVHEALWVLMCTEMFEWYIILQGPIIIRFDCLFSKGLLSLFILQAS